MEIVFYSNFINHHQKLLADCLSQLTEGHFTFVGTRPMPDSFRSSGYADYSGLGYVLNAWQSEENRAEARRLAVDADVALFGGWSTEYAVLRARRTDKLSFEISERWLKKGLLNLLSPRLLENQWHYRTLWRRKPFYKLCASAFGAADQYRLHSYRDRCYKWGYFTRVEPLDIASVPPAEGPLRMMWCSRFIDWKHPELPVLLAERLKSKGYDFVIDMYGSGGLLTRTKALAEIRGVDDVVFFHGNMPNDAILSQMRAHQVFLFTSDCNEGWGAVANEAMASGCLLVGSDAIGAMPFLVEDGVSGMLFSSAASNTGFRRRGLVIDAAALDSLTSRVESILADPQCMGRMASVAYDTISTVWSPDNAARNLMTLIDFLLTGEGTVPAEGPCSIAQANISNKK